MYHLKYMSIEHVQVVGKKFLIGIFLKFMYLLKTNCEICAINTIIRI